MTMKEFIATMKPKFDSYYNELRMGRRYKPEKGVDAQIQYTIDSMMFELYGVLEKTESPIEQILALELYRMERHKVGDLNFNFRIENQEIIKTRDGEYRVDFFITVTEIFTNATFERMNHGEQQEFSKSFIVECDGHDFHEKTKEQVARDKKRDRDLLAAGYNVLRYSGSEIYNDPFSCANEIFRHAKKLGEEVVEEVSKYE